MCPSALPARKAPAKIAAEPAMKSPRFFDSPRGCARLPLDGTFRLDARGPSVSNFSAKVHQTCGQRGKQSRRRLYFRPNEIENGPEHLKMQIIQCRDYRLSEMNLGTLKLNPTGFITRINNKVRRKLRNIAEQEFNR
jgi:hypothetical protein